MCLIKDKAIIIILLVTLALIGNKAYITYSDPSSHSLSYVDIIKKGFINLTKIRDHVYFLTKNCSPRITGYPGFYKAAEYIRRYFIEVGLENVTFQLYNITVPIASISHLEVYSPTGELLASFPIHPLWPNSVNPCSTQNTSGLIFYVGTGTYKECIGKRIEDSIVLMEFNSLDNWKRIFSLGAKAVIFIEPTDTNTYEAELKYLKYAPLRFPRAYIERKYAIKLLKLLKSKKDVRGRLWLNVKWEVKEVPNVIGFKLGADLKDQWILIFAHYDTWSVVPTLAEGATDALGVAVLLELAKFLSQVNTRRSVMFIAFSGWGEGLAGARYFVDKLMWENPFPWVLPEKAIGRGIFLEIGIDLSAETNMIGAFYTSHFYRIYRMGIIGRGAFTDNKLTPLFFTGTSGGFSLKDKMIEAWRKVYGKTWIIEGKFSFDHFTMKWDMYEPTPFCLDGDVFTAAQAHAGRGVPGSRCITYRTAYAYFSHRGTPLDTYARIGNLNNLRPQMEFIFCTIYDLANMDLEEMGIEKQEILDRSGWLAGGYRLGRLVGQVVEFDEKTGYYKPVPNTIVQISTTNPDMYYKHTWFEATDENGKFIVRGLSDRIVYKVVAYLVNQTNGQIIYAPDEGKYGTQAFPPTFKIHPQVGQYGSWGAPFYVVVFKCGVIQLAGLRAMTPSLGKSFATGLMQWVLLSPKYIVRVNDVTTHYEPDHFGYAVEDDVLIAFTDENISTELIVFHEPKLEEPLILLHNASPENMEEGLGYLVKREKTLSLSNALLLFAKDLYYLNEYRIRICSNKRVFTGAEGYHKQAGEALRKAEDALRNLDYEKYYSNIIRCIYLEKQVYRLLIPNLKDVINTACIYFILAILFAFIGEKLFFSFEEVRKKLLAVCSLFVIIITLMILFHPGFTIATNIYVALLGLGIAAMITPLLAIVTGQTLEAVKKLKKLFMGKHFTEISRLSFTISALNVGISYMRERKIETALTLSSIVLLTLAMVMFTSILGLRVIKPFSYKGIALYSGVYVREVFWRPLSFEYIEYLRCKYASEAYIFPRAWKYPLRPDEGSGGLIIGPTGNTFRIRAYYGITSLEGKLMKWPLVKGMWFMSDYEDGCILTEKLAKVLNVDVGDTLFVEGVRLKVIGILSDEVTWRLDLDQKRSTPFDITKGEAELVFMSPSEIIFVPYGWLVERNGLPYTVVIVPFNLKKAKEIAINLATESQLYFYVAESIGEKKPIELYSSTAGFEVVGYRILPIPIAIVMLTMLNLMLGVITRKHRDIYIFSSIGMSPLHVMFLLLAQVVAYAIIGAIIGYTLGITCLRLAYAIRALPEWFYPNYAASSVLNVLGLLMLSVILSSIYPLRIAAKMVTPSLRRKWRIETRPLGNIWYIPLPFVFVGEEAKGVLEFIKEYLLSYTEPIPGAPFAVEECTIEEREVEGAPARVLSSIMHVAPFPLGIKQKTEIYMIQKDNKWQTMVVIERMSGKMEDWIRVNEKMIDSIRKQCLIWRGLKPMERKEYIDRAKR